MKIHLMEQRSPEWRAIRLCHITATNFDTMANGKKTTIETLCEKVAAEIITGVSRDGEYTNAAMERGIALEPYAISAYETTEFVHVQRVGFIEMDDLIGFSPDGLIVEDGGIEVKCPLPHTHLKYLSKEEAWKDYAWQVQGALWITGRDYWIFASYCPDFPAEKQLLVEIVNPDKDYFDKLDAGALACRQMIQEMVKTA